MKKHLTTCLSAVIISIFIFCLILFFYPKNLQSDTISGDIQPAYNSSESQQSGSSAALYNDFIDLEASSAILMDAASGNILWEKNSSRSIYPASITKIMTCILAIEKIEDLDETIEISKNASGANNSAFFFNEGDRISLMDLLKAALISSHNNATIALAEYISGDIKDFVDMMNSKAIELGAYNTNFENTNGLDSSFPGHKTTAYDIALISRYAMGNKLFRDIVGTYTDDIRINDEIIPIVNTNKLLTNDYLKGIKTGYTENAGFCLAAFSDLNGLELITVVLDSGVDTREKDALSLIYWADNNIKTVKLVDSLIPLETVELGDTTKTDVDLYAAGDISMMIHVTNNHVEVSHIILGNTGLPVGKDEIMGSVTVKINGKNIGNTDIVSKESIDGPDIFMDISEKPRKETIILISVILSFYFLIIIFIIFKNLVIKNIQTTEDLIE